MKHPTRPLADRLEVEAPSLAAGAVRVLSWAPEPVRRRVLQSAFDRARDAFNRGDLLVVFALFAEDVEYGPPPPLHDGGLIHGRSQVFDFWRDVRDRFDDNSIENLMLREAHPGSFVRTARLHHRSSATNETLDYTIVQTTELRAGRVVRQINLLEATAD